MRAGGQGQRGDLSLDHPELTPVFWPAQGISRWGFELSSGSPLIKCECGRVNECVGVHCHVCARGTALCCAN